MTKKLKDIAVWFWSCGFAFAAANGLYSSVETWNISWSYIFFIFAAGLCVWAEKREFGTRVFLYRLHDLVIFQCWKYLLLFFLWISLFALFTTSPLRSILYVAAGCFNLFAIALVPQFLFADRGLEKIALLPQRLSIAFFAYAISQIILFLSAAVSIVHPNYFCSLLLRDTLDLYLYFMIGFPFLLWDFSKAGRRILPRWISCSCLALGILSLFFVGKKFFLFSLLFCIIFYLSIAMYKKNRVKKILLSFLALLGFAITLLAIFFCTIYLLDFYFFPVIKILHQILITLHEHFSFRFKSVFIASIKIVTSTHFLGTGVGISEIKGVFTRVIAETGIVGFLLYTFFFLSLLKALFFVRREKRIVISNIAFISASYFLLLGSHYIANPYGPNIWAWYAIWALFSTTRMKKDVLAA